MCYLVWVRPEPTLPKRSEEEMDMDGEVEYDVDDDLCEVNDQHQVTSVVIRIFCADHVDILQTIKYLSL